MSANTRFSGSIAARARNIFGNVRITCGQSDDDIVTSLHPPIHPKTFSRLIITDQSISAPQLRAAARFAAEQIGDSTDRVLGYVRKPEDPAYDAIHQMAAAEVFRSTRKDLRRLRLRLSRIEEAARTIRTMHRSLPSCLLTAPMVRRTLPPNVSIWQRRLISLWSNQQRQRLEQLCQHREIQCCLLDTTLRQLAYASAEFVYSKGEEIAEQFEHLVFCCIDEMEIRIPVVNATDGVVLQILALPWSRYESVVLYDNDVSLRRDRRGNRFLYDAKLHPDARRVVVHDVACYLRIARRSSDPTGRDNILNLWTPDR